jgi:6-phosphogluconate dehydrogenase
MPQADIGLIGLAVMGQNLVLNMSDKGYTVAVHNRTVDKVDAFIAGPAKDKSIIGCHSLKEFFAQLKSPRRVMLMVKAGNPVDTLIEQCLEYMDAGDIIIDGGNSLYTDSDRRYETLKEKGIHFVGAGVSGGEEGARYGPSIMPGGSAEAWPHIKDIFRSIAAKSFDGKPCCEWIGSGGAGHYVKMVHNGIEYGDMQLICEAYSLMSQGLGLDADAMHKIFSEWNKEELNSYLVEITAQILKTKDEDGSPLVEKILDTAGQKGTGKWVCIHALEMGSPLSLIAEAVFARCISALKEERVAASKILQGPDATFSGDKQEFIEYIRQALYASKIISYAQGFALMQQASKDYDWNLDLQALATIWQGGCIIRSSFLTKIAEAYNGTKAPSNLLLDDYFKNEILAAQSGWRHVIAQAVQIGIPVPCFSMAVAYFDSYRSARLPANLLQAQRDFFGAHTYERIDKRRGEFFHTNWTGTGGNVSSSTYNV